MTRCHDVAIVGSGAGGGALAFALAGAGVDVLVLEKGPRLTRQDYRHDELAVLHRPFLTPDLASDPHTVVTRKTTRSQRTSLGYTAVCVGGGTVRMGGYLLRFTPDDFRVRSTFGPVEEASDWPYDYGALEPYYSRAEWAIGVSGQAGSDPAAAYRSRPYPLPPLRAHALTPWLEEGAARRGLRLFPTPRAIASRDYADRPACVGCAVCAGYGCPVGARGSSQEALLARAEASGHCEVRPLSAVSEITVTSDGRARGAVYQDAEGRSRSVEARVVCVSASAVESARLLLRSRSPRFPDGLANANGQVGRHLQFHAVTSGVARFRASRLPTGDARAGGWLDRCSSDHLRLPAGVGMLPKGGLIRFGVPTPAPILAAKRLALGGSAPLFGAPLAAALRRRYEDAFEVEVEVFHDYLPNAGTYVDLDPEVRDRWNEPCARIHLDPSPHHAAAGRWLLDRACEVLSDLGAESFVSEVVGGTSSYLVHGTCRAGHDPRESVLDGFCRAHEVPNLYVVDGSFMPTSGSMPPTLTIVANALRTADHLLERFRSGEFS